MRLMTLGCHISALSRSKAGESGFGIYLFCCEHGLTLVCQAYLSDCRKNKIKKNIKRHRNTFQFGNFGSPVPALVRAVVATYLLLFSLQGFLKRRTRKSIPLFISVSNSIFETINTPRSKAPFFPSDYDTSTTHRR